IAGTRPRLCLTTALLDGPSRTHLPSCFFQYLVSFGRNRVARSMFGSASGAAPAGVITSCRYNRSAFVTFWVRGSMTAVMLVGDSTRMIGTPDPSPGWETVT